ncbi:MAG TPA: hypothetical protein VN327_09820 [Pseudonocardiaceae bacterium]|jgi:hypothetical protein|nr:hypothetical protein [Pseudonocardiaceae bacterium]
MTSSFEQAGAQLVQQTSLAAAVAAGELWMEAGVAERAATRCDQAVEEIDDWLVGAQRLTKRCKFGDNEDGNAAAEQFVQAGQEFIDSMRSAQRMFANMAVTYRAAGRTVTEADAANEQMFQGRSE